MEDKQLVWEFGVIPIPRRRQPPIHLGPWDSKCILGVTGAHKVVSYFLSEILLVKVQTPMC